MENMIKDDQIKDKDNVKNVVQPSRPQMAI
jgi:hypothetical protein